jgi:predicted RNase H-like HicB family nuclease
MSSPMRNYIALIHKDAGTDYGVSFPDLPGVITAGASLDEARSMAAEALALHLEGLSAEGEAIPEPTSLEAVMADPVNRSGVAVLVAAPEGPPKVVRVNITMAEDLLCEIDRHAEEHGFTRSGFLAAAARRIVTDARAADAAEDPSLGKPNMGWLSIFRDSSAGLRLSGPTMPKDASDDAVAEATRLAIVSLLEKEEDRNLLRELLARWQPAKRATDSTNKPRSRAKTGS